MSLRFLRAYLKCQTPVALRYWYGAWRRGTSRQVIESQNSGSGHCTRLAATLDLPGNVGVAGVLEGAWHLAV